MSGKKIPTCECGRMGWHRIGNEWECARCQQFRLDDELNRQIHPQDFISRFYDGEQWADAEDRGREYQRIYNMTVRRERAAKQRRAASV